MSHEVIMPALGMTQDTGKLVKWHKAVGEKVSRSEILMEIETDKSTMEVEAGADGFMAEILSKEGEDVPVGQVVAIITDDGEISVPTNKSELASNKLMMPDNRAAMPEKELIENPSIEKSIRDSQSSKKKILASPKAKVFAKSRTVSLESMRAMGFNEPFHFSDVSSFLKENDVIRRDETPEEPNLVTRSKVTRGLLSAESDETKFQNMLFDLEFSDKKERVFGCFVAGAYRRTLENRNQPVYVRIICDTGMVMNLKDPDLSGFRAVRDREDQVSNAPNIIIRDISYSPITFCLPTEIEEPEIWITRKNVSDQGILVFTLAYGDDSMNSLSAINLIEGLVKRIAMPLYHLT